MSSNCATTDYFRGHVPKEYDSGEREAQFFLYSRPLDDFVLGHSNDKEIHHWILVAIFDDESVRTLEAFKSKERKKELRPKFTKTLPRVDGTKIFRLNVTMSTSPSKLREIAITNTLNGLDYGLIKNNCQNWVKEAAKALNLDLAKALEKHKTSGEINAFILGGKAVLAFSNSSSNSVSSLIKKLTDGYWSSKSSKEGATS